MSRVDLISFDRNPAPDLPRGWANVTLRRFQRDGGFGIFPSRIAACHANVAMMMADCFRSSSLMRSG